MTRPDTDEVKCLIPAVTDESNSIIRGAHLPSCFSSGPASTVSTFLVGLASGAAGGLLLGAAAVVMLQSLQLLEANEPLMEKLQNLVEVKGRRVGAEAVGNASRCNERQLNVGVSVLAEAFGVAASVLSLAAGACAASSVCSLTTGGCRQAATAKAAAVAGTTCLTCAAVSGSLLGLGLESFLSFLFCLDFSMWLPASLHFTGMSFLYLLFFYVVYHFFELSGSCLFPVVLLVLTPGAVYAVILISMFFKTKLVLVVALVPSVCALRRLEKTHDVQLTAAPVLLMLTVTEAFNIANRPIVAPQSPASADTVAAVHEGLFVGLLTSQLFTAAVGMCSFASWRRAEAAHVCAAAAGCGAAALAAIKGAQLVLGPGPTIGALVGVAGAVGVSLAAAEAATDQWGRGADRGLEGRLGVTLGAAAGALLSSCSHSGLSGAFMALCAAAAPAGLRLQPLLQLLCRRCTWLNVNLFVCVIILAALLIWCNFACAAEFASNELIPIALIPFLQWSVLLLYTLNMDK